MTWSIRIGDLHGDNHVLVSADMPGLVCVECGRVARATLCLSEALCDRCCKDQLQVGKVSADVFSLPTVHE